MSTAIDPAATAHLALKAAFSRWALDDDPTWFERCYQHSNYK